MVEACRVLGITVKNLYSSEEGGGILNKSRTDRAKKSAYGR